MNLTRTVAPTEYPATRAQVRKWCAMVDSVTDDDDLLDELIIETYAYMEQRLAGYKPMASTWKIELDASEVGAMIRLPIAPLQTVTSIKVTNDAGTQSTVASTNYQVRDGDDPRIVLSPTGSWPTMRTYDAMEIICTVGVAAASLPMDLRMLFRGLVLHFYNGKGVGVTQTVSGQIISIPNQFERQLASWRMDPFGASQT